MVVKQRAEIIKNWIDDYCKSVSFELKSLVVGISGGIDSSVVSTLCALTGRKTIVLSMPIKQHKDQHNLSMTHGKWLTENYKNVEHKIVVCKVVVRWAEDALMAAAAVGVARGMLGGSRCRQKSSMLKGLDHR